MNKLNINKKIASLLALPVVLLTGCGKSDCDLKEFHLHKYTKDGFVRYIADEDLKNCGYDWNEDLVYVKESDRNLYEFEYKKDLLKIDDNIDVLRAKDKEFDDFVEYEYSYTEYVPKTDSNGHTTIKIETHHSWTTDKTHSNLTGDVRLLRYYYINYKIIVNEKGKYKLVKGNKYENIEDIISNKDEYPYMDVNYYDIDIVSYGELDEMNNPYFDSEDAAKYGSRIIRLKDGNIYND